MNLRKHFFVMRSFLILAFTFLILKANAQVTLETGIYVGSGLDNQTISGLGFEPDMVIVKVENASHEGQIRVASMPDGFSRQLVGSSTTYTNRIKSFTSDGFVIGTHYDVNQLDKTYYWTAFKGGPGLVVGSYTGNGASSRSITGIGFSPAIVFMLPSTANRASFRTSTFTNTNCSAFGSDFNISSTITAMEADGFKVGNAPNANKSGEAYYYAAIMAFPGSVSVGSYLGNGIDNTAINGVGLRAEFMTIKSSSSNYMAHKTNQMPDISTVEFASSRIDDNRIHNVNDDGFVVGTQGQVNTNNTKYHYICMKNYEPIPPAVCIKTGSYIGDGSGNKEITGVGFSPAVVMIKALDGSYEAQIRTSTMNTGYSRQMVGASAQYLNHIKNFTSDGFVVGSNNDVNAVGKTYYWTAYDFSNVMEVGTYIGDGTSNRTISGVQFTPDMLWLLPRTQNRASWKSRTFTNGNCSAFGNDFGISNTINALVPGGFVIGSSARANKIGEVYSYVAFKEDPNFLSLGSYTGNGTNISAVNNISIPGFSIQYMFIKSAGSSAAIQKSDLMPASASVEFSGSRTDANRITYMGNDGFTVGGYNVQVNKYNMVYHYVAFYACGGLGKQMPAVLQTKTEEMNIYPNPANELFAVKLNNKKNETAKLTIIDQSGRMVINIAVSLASGVNNFSVKVSDLPAGMYLVRLTNGSGTKTSKLVINK